MKCLIGPKLDSTAIFWMVVDCVESAWSRTPWLSWMLAVAITFAVPYRVVGQEAKRNPIDASKDQPTDLANRSVDVARRVLTLDQDDWGRPVALEGYGHLRRKLMEGLEGRAIVSGESLDLARFNQPGYLDELRVWLGRKYAKFKPEVIVAFGEECLTFASRLRAELWPETPIVFAAIPLSDFGNCGFRRIVREWCITTFICRKLWRSPVSSFQKAVVSRLSRAISAASHSIRRHIRSFSRFQTSGSGST
jgi:hypothetical protein